MRFQRPIRFVAALLVVAVLAIPATAAADDDASPTYLALGNSLAEGVGASDPAKKAYVPRFGRFLEDRLDVDDGELNVVNLGVGGATSETLLTDQLPAAVATIATLNGDGDPDNDVEVITVEIGGNDVFALLAGPCAGGVSPECVAAIEATFTGFATNFGTALGTLRAVAGPDTAIVVMTYYNSLIACDLSAFAPLADVVLEGDPAVLPVGLNDLIRIVAGSVPGVAVAETYGQLDASDLVGGADCLHPDDSGHKEVASAFKDAFKANFGDAFDED